MYDTTTSTACRPQHGVFERPRYFARQLVTPAELNLESRYFVDRMRRHNRLLHGWGVVCGAQVCRVPTSDGNGAEPWKVRIRPGFLIDGHGNEVEITCERIVDLRSTGVTVGCGDPPGELDDPWCNDVPVEREPGEVWLAVCYRECLVRPVRSQPTGCECDETPCEYSRWQDGYEVRLLTECPESHQGPPPEPEDYFQKYLHGRLPDCPDCPEDPCVVLAMIDVGSDGTIVTVDNCSCRRMVLSTAEFWWRCRSRRVAIHDVRITQKTPAVRGARGVKLVARGDNLRGDTEVELGPGVEVTSKAASASGSTLTLMLDIHESADPGDRMLTLTADDCSSASFPAAVRIEDPPSAPRR